ncbi:uncharacterized protein LOC144798737 isoform X2 [Lissotriton helveticus]
MQHLINFGSYRRWKLQCACAKLTKVKNGPKPVEWLSEKHACCVCNDGMDGSRESTVSLRQDSVGNRWRLAGEDGINKKPCRSVMDSKVIETVTVHGMPTASMEKPDVSEEGNSVVLGAAQLIPVSIRNKMSMFQQTSGEGRGFPHSNLDIQIHPSSSEPIPYLLSTKPVKIKVRNLAGVPVRRKARHQRGMTTKSQAQVQRMSQRTQVHQLNSHHPKTQKCLHICRRPQNVQDPLCYCPHLNCLDHCLQQHLHHKRAGGM